MEHEVTIGIKMLNGFLRIMVACLVLILFAIPIALILDWMGLI